MVLLIICSYAGFLGMFFAVLGMFGKDRDAIAEYGFFQGYNYVVWATIILQVCTDTSFI